MRQLGEKMEAPADLEVVLCRLNREVGELARNYSIKEVSAMLSGLPREGAPPNEVMAREKFAQIRAIESAFNIHH